MSTLLEQAKAYRLKKPAEVAINAEEREVYIAILKGEVEIYQARKVLPANFDHRFRHSMCELYKRGLLEIKSY